MYKSKLWEGPRVKFTIALVESSADDVVSFKFSLNAIGASPTVQLYETVDAAIEVFETLPVGFDNYGSHCYLRCRIKTVPAAYLTT